MLGPVESREQSAMIRSIPVAVSRSTLLAKEGEMIGVSLLFIMQIAGQVNSTSDTASLVEQLGSVRYADREDAARTLQVLGKEAIPALVAGRSSNDMEIRTRAEGLLHKIEGSLLTEPTMVRLDFEDVPLPELVKSLADQAGMRICLFPENSPRWKTQRVSLQEPGPLPFWKAIDRLCHVASLQSDVEMSGLSARGEATLCLTDRITSPALPTSDHGPFRVGLVELDFHSRVGFAPAPPQLPRKPVGRPGPNRGDVAAAKPMPVTSVQCSAQFQLMAEPRLGVTQCGPPRILEARDDLDNSLLAENRRGMMLNRNSTFLTGTCTSVIHLNVPLARPENPGRSIKTLRGEVPLRVSARRPDPLIVPLAGAGGKTFVQGDVQLTIHDVRIGANSRGRQIDLSVRERHEGVAPATDDFSLHDPSSRLESHLLSIEILDAQNRPLPWVQTDLEMESSRLTLTMSSSADAAEPKELRYYRLTETMVDVPFSFADVPMP
jgi:hypothetical protein